MKALITHLNLHVYTLVKDICRIKNISVYIHKKIYLLINYL